MTVAQYKKQEEVARKRLIEKGQRITKEDIANIAAKLNYGQKSVENYLNGTGTSLYTSLRILEA